MRELKKRSLEEIAAPQRAYSIIEIKSIDEDKRIIEGVATTPTPDRMDDIVEPDGAEFSLPLPFLWQHESRNAAIGHVIRARPSKDGIPVVVKVERATPDDPQSMRDHLDFAWSAIKKGLVRGLSIGFNPKEWTEIKGTFGLRFTKWDWLELSAVTIPANAEATITAIKSADRSMRAASGAKHAVVVRLDPNSPGASGSTATKKREDEMKTYQERIKEFEAARAAKQARREEIQNKASAEGRTKDAAEQEEFDNLKAEIAAIDRELVDLNELSKANAAATRPVPPAAGESADIGSAARLPAGSGIRVEANVPKGMAFARLVKALAVAKGSPMEALAFAEAQKGWRDTTPQVVQHLKTAVAGGTTSGSAWADDIVYNQNLVSEFIELLHPATIIGRLQGLRRVPFNIRVGSQTSGGTGYWVGEGKAIPASKLQTDNVTLGIAKAAGLMVITKELARSSAPSAEALVRDDLIKTVVEFLDKQFIDPNFGPVTATGAPGSILYGVTAQTPSGTTAAALRADVRTLFDNWLNANLNPAGGVWIMSPNIALSISLMMTSLGTPEFPGINMNGGTFVGLPVVTSYSAFIAGSPNYAHLMALVLPSEIFLADDGGMEIDVSEQASIQMDDAPTNETPTPTATTLVSMWQTESLAVKLVRYINWKKKRSTAASYIRTAAYVDA